MQRYIARRLLLGALTGLLVSLMIFALLRVAPGDVAMMIALDMTGGEEDLVTEEQLARIREDLGLNRPLPAQYFSWIGGIVTGNWGESMFSSEGIWDNFKSKLPVTLELAIASVVLSTLLGIPSGILMALRQDTWIDYGLRIFSLAGPFDDPVANASQFFWPAVIVGYSAMATKARMMRSTMLEVIRQDYIRTAHAKGLASSVVMYRHALKNALIPVVTVVGLSVAAILGGSVIMERIFVLDGIGNMLVEGMNQRDFPVVQSLVLVFSLWIVLVNLLIDLSYGLLDPRVRYS